MLTNCSTVFSVYGFCVVLTVNSDNFLITLFFALMKCRFLFAVRAEPYFLNYPRIKVDGKNIESETVDWIQLFEFKVKLLAPLNPVMNRWVPQGCL
jgi:hypothetical protein